MAETQTATSSLDYSSESVLLHDLNMWIVWSTSADLTLAHLPKVAEERWPWIVDNWTTLYPGFVQYTNGNERSTNALVDMANNVFAWKTGNRVNPLSNSAFFNSAIEFLILISIQGLTLTTQEDLYIKEELKRVSEFTSENFKAMLRFVKSRRDGVFDRVGLGDPYYSEIKGRTSLKKIRDYSIEDLDYTEQLITLERYISGIILEFRNKGEHSPNLLAFSQANISSDSDVNFETGYKTFISVPFTTSLEQMAQDYLGDKGGWYELVSVNNLKPPYVDRLGEKELLIETGAGSSVHVNARFPTRMRIGAILKIGSKVVPEEIRRIEATTDNKDGTTTLLLNGSSNLNKFKTEHGAYLRLFSPETIQEFSFVKIPYTVGPDTPNMPEPELQKLKDLDDALYQFGVDMAISEITGDLLVSQNGDLKIRFGIPAVRQAVWLSLRTPAGQLPLHPAYGVRENLGDSMFGSPTIVKFSTVVEDSVKQDSRYTAVSMKNITFGNTDAMMTINVGVANQSQLIPFTFAL